MNEYASNNRYFSSALEFREAILTAGKTPNAKYMLDTTLCIYTLKNKPEAVREIFNQHHGRMCISSVTLMALIYGAEKSVKPDRNMRVVEGFTARLEVISYGSDAASHTGQTRAELAKLGTPVGPYDSIIAADARSMGLILVTNNSREFIRLPGLRLEDWTVR